MRTEWNWKIELDEEDQELDERYAEGILFNTLYETCKRSIAAQRRRLLA